MHGHTGLSLPLQPTARFSIASSSSSLSSSYAPSCELDRRMNEWMEKAPKTQKAHPPCTKLEAATGFYLILLTLIHA